MIEKAGPLIVKIIVSAAINTVWAQPAPVCYFGECDESSPAPVKRQPTAPDSSPSRNPPTVPEGRTGSNSPASSRFPPFLARNLCFYGAKAVPVKDADTCMRLYLKPSATPRDGSPVDCGLVALDPKGTGFTVRAQPVRTVGECFGTTNSIPKSVRSAISRCSLLFAQGFEHFRFDMDPARCKRRAIELKAQIVQ